MSRDPVLELRNVSHEFPGRRGFFGTSHSVRAVDQVSLVVKKGDVLGLVGESGSGKSTLAKIMLGLLKPDSGEVFLSGLEPHTMTRKQVADQVSFIFQDPYSSLNPRHTVGCTVAYSLYLRGEGSSRDRKERAREILDVVGLDPRFLDAYPHQMSGGQRQRAVIARALISNPKLLICDEPTSALDVSVQSQVLNLLLKLRKDFELTLIMISHNLSVIQHMSTRVAVMYLGKIVELDLSESLFKHPRHPYTQLLLSSTLSVDPGAGIPDLQTDSTVREAMREHPSFLSV
ncbi:ATP-binding cassette domain-containing protein [Sinorhizobium medicae]|nr:ATP-binding cassette domain-containing protein [Sinorhizobium medicae]MDX0901548.1 ATP-binding cassette domain-containing protein [Sinorhizobium medicae]MDX1177282.1 ATP-binding cassette domain-containing protein [Sinorhizobium medicae]